MRVMVIVKATRESEAGKMPSEKLPNIDGNEDRSIHQAPVADVRRRRPRMRLGQRFGLTG